MQKTIKVRYRFFAVILGLMLFSVEAWSVGAGELVLESKLGQPLRASIQLSDTGDLSTEQIAVSLAPVAMFRQMEIERSYNLLSLEFVVTDQKTISITSRKPINEPFLNFVIEVHWPQGKIYREYKVFLDPV